MSGKEIVIFSSGVVAGIAATLIVCKKRYELKADEEIASYKEYADRKIEAYKNDAVKAEKKYDILTKIKSPEAKKENKILEGKEVKKEYVNYSRTYIPPEDAENEEDEEEELEEEELGKEILDKELAEEKDPFEISGDDFGEIPSYDIESLYLYKDGTLTDSNEEPIDGERKSIVGTIIEDSGFTYDNSILTLYVRNPRVSTDYEISKVDSYFG